MVATLGVWLGDAEMKTAVGADAAAGDSTLAGTKSRVEERTKKTKRKKGGSKGRGGGVCSMTSRRGLSTS